MVTSKVGTHLCSLRAVIAGMSSLGYNQRLSQHADRGPLNLKETLQHPDETAAQVVVAVMIRCWNSPSEGQACCGPATSEKGLCCDRRGRGVDEGGGTGL